jgi:hypothetical protein
VTELGAEDAAIHRLVVDVSSEIGEDLAEISLEWDGGGQMWFTHVRPKRESAAPVQVGYDGGLSISVAETWLELRWPEDSATLEALLRGVITRGFEQAGWSMARTGRVQTETGRFSFGHTQFPPWPWRLRRVKRFSPYL